MAGNENETPETTGEGETPVTTVPETTWQQRLVEEHDALRVKLAALHTFIGSSEFRALAPGDSDLMYQQLSHMNNYAQVLQARISRLPQ